MIKTDDIIQINVVVNKNAIVERLSAMGVPDEYLGVLEACVEDMAQEVIVLEHDDDEQLDSMASIIASSILPEEKEESEETNPLTALKKKILDSVDEIFPDE